jgi:hypothetical protein
MARDITVKFKGDAGDLEGDARRAANAMDKFGDAAKRSDDKMPDGGKVGGLKGALSSLGGVAKVAAGNMVANLAGTAATAVTDFVGDSIEAASRLQQAQGGVDAVFGKSAGVVTKYASTSADRLGLAGAEYRELATVAGAQLKNAGQSTDQAAKSTDGLITKAADLSATFGGSTKDAMEAISSLMKGETDPIEKYGVSIKQTDINARLAAEGHSKLTGSAKKTAEAQARLALLTEQTSDATGAFAKENDTLAGKQQRANAKMEDAKAKLGEALLPAMTAVTGFMADQMVPGLIAAGEAIGVFVGWLADKLGPAFTTVLGYIQPVIETIQELWARFGDVILGQIQNVFNTIVGVLQAFFQIIKGIFEVFAGLLTGDWSRMWEGIKSIASGVFNYLKTIIMYFVNSIKAIFTIAWRAISDIFGTSISTVVRFVSELPGKVGRALSSLGSTLWNIAKAAWDAMGRAVTKGIDDIVSWVSKLPGRIWKAIGDLYDKAWHIGADLVRGIGHGLDSLLQWLIDKATSLFNKPIEIGKKIFHIGSPSKVMMEMGRDVMRGFTLGMDKEGPAVAQAVANPLDYAGAALPPTTSARSSSSGAAATGGVTVNITVTPLSNPVEVGRAVVDAIASFERMNGTKWRQTA